MKQRSKSIPPVLLLLVSFFVQGCGLRSITPDKSDIERVSSGRVIAVNYAPPEFIAEYPGFEQGKYNKGLSGEWVGTWEWMGEWSALAREGEKLIRDFGLVDPGIQVRDGLAGYLEKDLGFAPIALEKEDLKDDSLPALRERFGTGAVLDFMTTSWKLYHYPYDWSRYRVALQVRGRLIDLKDSKVLWRGWCTYAGAEQGPTFEELSAENGAQLKSMLLEAASSCADELKGQFRALK